MRTRFRDRRHSLLSLLRTRLLTDAYWLMAFRMFLSVPSFPGARYTARRLANLYLGRLEVWRGRTRLRSRPIKLNVEATNICNLECPACFTGVGENGRARSHMSLELYRKLLDELGPYLFQVELHNWGEPLLARHLVPMIEEAHRAGIQTTLSTNFSFPFTAERAEAIVRAGLDVFGVSIDGAQQETYEQYRRGGKLDTVLANCRLMRDAKRRLGSATPLLIWEFHVFSHNTDDIERARALAADLEMGIAVVKGWVAGPEWDVERRFGYFADSSPFPCSYLWHHAIVNNDGGVAPCCGTFYREDDMGRVATATGEEGNTTFREVWNSDRFQTARRFFNERSGSAADHEHICFECPTTKLWERYRAHVAAGGTFHTFSGAHSANDTFNYFWNRRPTGSEARRRRV